MKLDLFVVLHDANFNVIGITNSSKSVIARYGIHAVWRGGRPAACDDFAHSKFCCSRAEHPGDFLSCQCFDNCGSATFDPSQELEMKKGRDLSEDKAATSFLLNKLPA